MCMNMRKQGNIVPAWHMVFGTRWFIMRMWPLSTLLSLCASLVLKRGTEAGVEIRRDH